MLVEMNTDQGKGPADATTEDQHEGIDCSWHRADLTMAELLLH